MCFKSSFLFAWILFFARVRLSQGAMTAKEIGEGSHASTGVEIEARGIGQMWLPNLKGQDEFIRDIHAPSGVEASVNIKPSGCKSTKFFGCSMGKFFNHGKLLHGKFEVIRNFKHKLQEATGIEGKIQLFNNAVAYLLRKSNLEPEEIKVWIEPLDKISQEIMQSDLIEPKAEILIGFKNLYLKYSKEKILEEIIKMPMEKIQKHLQRTGSRLGEEYCTMWVKGMCENLKKKQEDVVSFRWLTQILLNQ